MGTPSRADVEASPVEIDPRAPDASREPHLPTLGPHGEGWVLIQTALAILLLVGSAVDPLALGEPARSYMAILGALVCLAGSALFAWGAMELGPSFSIWVTPLPNARLVTTGPYACTRNPICTAQSVFALGWALMWGSPIGLGLAVVYAAYLDRGKLAREEETLLVRYPEYREYMRRVTHRMWPAPPRRRETANAHEVTGAVPGS
jgi:protein-S-isoprenylcysteine O-methyltransferase Ste14